jgi:hypothetical protein
MYDFTKAYEYVVMIDEREVSFEYFGNDFRAAVQTISNIKAICPEANVRYFHNDKEIPLV